MLRNVTDRKQGSSMHVNCDQNSSTHLTVPFPELVFRLEETKRGFVLLRRPWVVELEQF
ncbi:hypothetical protein QFZ89_005165 [Paraburkholderia youngii]|uniref:Uncharacterized protein n=1 Tax=Paraburkholderia youngii TaxID=2782701 RepID=A0A7W8P1M9_9BURK|nr:hypothetical protein [Paraburkholderia youngii]